MLSGIIRHQEGGLQTGLGWYVQTVPGPSPCLFSASLTKFTEQPWRLHCVPGATVTIRSSSSITTGSCWGTAGPLAMFDGGAEDLVE